MARRFKSGTYPDITLAIDFGGSLTKVIYASSDENWVVGQDQLLVMEPEVAAVDPSTISQLNQVQIIGAAKPENRAWIGLEQKYWAVGYLAKSKFGAHSGLKELKYERGLYKTLAAIWAIKEKLQLGSRFRVAIAVLLPPGEYEDRFRFQEQLAAALRSYVTPTGSMKIAVEMFNCKPEGGGILLSCSAIDQDEFEDQVFAVVMLGFRNANVLVSERGVVSPGKTSEHGFVRMIEKVQARTSGQLSTERLAAAIVEAGPDIQARPFIALAPGSTEQGRAEEIEQLITATRAARAEYSAMLLSWLDETLPREIDQVVFCGGTSDYLAPELIEHFRFSNYSFHAGIELPERFSRHRLGNRLADVYGVFDYLKGRVIKSCQMKALAAKHTEAING
jgi:hypothetical protein